VRVSLEQAPDAWQTRRKPPLIAEASDGQISIRASSFGAWPFLTDTGVETRLIFSGRLRR
jgi:hypothetical protein